MTASHLLMLAAFLTLDPEPPERITPELIARVVRLVDVEGTPFRCRFDPTTGRFWTHYYEAETHGIGFWRLEGSTLVMEEWVDNQWNGNIPHPEHNRGSSWTRRYTLRPEAGHLRSHSGVWFMLAPHPRGG